MRMVNIMVMVMNMVKSVDEVVVMIMNMIKKVDEVVVMMMKDQCHCPGSVRVYRQDHPVRLKSRHLLVPANAHMGLCVLTFVNKNWGEATNIQFVKYQQN